MAVHDRVKGIPYRYPIYKAILLSKDSNCREDLKFMMEDIMEELNVKFMEIREDEESFVDFFAKANFKKLGSRCGKDMKLVAKAIESLSQDVLLNLTKNPSFEYELEFTTGRKIAITYDDLDLRREPKEGFVVANEGDITLMLDTSYYPELHMEYTIKSINRVLQNLRKDSKLAVDCRISVECCAEDDDMQILNNHFDYFSREALITEFVRVEVLDTEVHEIEGCMFQFKIVAK